MNDEPKPKHQTNPSKTRGYQLAAERNRAMFADLVPLIKSFLETHPNSTVRQIANAVSRSINDVRFVCFALEQSGDIELSYRLRLKRKRR